MFEKFKNYLFKSYHRPSAKILHIFVLFKSIFYNKKTILFSEKMFLLKDPPNSTIYLNFLGRIMYITINIITIIFLNRFYNNNTFIDNGEDSKKNTLLIKKGNDDSVWPAQSLNFLEQKKIEVDKDFLHDLNNSYNYSIELTSTKKNYEDSEWWKTCRDEYKKEFLENGNLNLTALENFRSKTKTNSAIISDLSYLKSSQKRIDKIKSLSLVNLYHKISDYIDLEVLRKASESFVGKNICLNYRNQRLSHSILRHAYFCSQISKFTELKTDEHNIIADIGGGYGGLARLLKYTFKKSTIIIFEIPEACILATYFLKRNFPSAKIGQAIDFKNPSSFEKESIKKFDFIILPQPKIENISDDSIDLIINTISMGEMTNETQKYYLKNIERVTKNYFYSVNRPKERVEKFNAQGFYNWNFEKKWDVKLYNFSYTYHIEFLGKKSNY